MQNWPPFSSDSFTDADMSVDQGPINHLVPEYISHQGATGRPSTPFHYQHHQTLSKADPIRELGPRLDFNVGPGAVFNDATMNEVHGNQTVYNAPVSYNQGDDLTKLRHVPTAGIRAQSQDGCLQGTRVALLERLQDWSLDQNAPRVYWLVGAAGAGKSALAWRARASRR
ncbi:hypothetical protein HGRIS_001548 [Hohenbuehelia grisea]|uniref:Uncharacterized protein n=1 Tax=Hohenbuehelia grisea TaxID=104357 RepID=A0ABR3JQF1_9AGAR